MQLGTDDSGPHCAEGGGAGGQRPYLRCYLCAYFFRPTKPEEKCMTVADIVPLTGVPPTSLNVGSAPLDHHIVLGPLPSSVKGIFIVTPAVKLVPLGSHVKTLESATKPSGGGASVAVIVISVGAASAPFGIVTVAPPTSIVSPSGPTVFFTEPEDEEDVDELSLLQPSVAASKSAETPAKIRTVSTMHAR